VRPRSALHEYQKRAVDQIVAKDELMLWVPLGGGKTAIALTAIADLGCNTIVVGTKRIVEMTWPNEINDWQHLSGITYAAATGSKKARETALASKPWVLGVNYESLGWLLLAILYPPIALVGQGLVPAPMLHDAPAMLRLALVLKPDHPVFVHCRPRMLLMS